MQKFSAAQAIDDLTPGDKGILQIILDDCANLSDDDTMEELEASINGEEIASGSLAGHMAYDIVHTLKREIS